LSTSVPALGCEYPDEGNMPLRRAVSQVKYLPETEAWSKALSGNVLYLLQLEQTLEVRNRCYWTLDALGDGALWQRFYVSPDGRHVLVRDPRGGPVSLERWRGGLKARAAAPR
jgi:hypothetical protein